jgi:basic amino acid/polyamine antiporter, APA family
MSDPEQAGARGGWWGSRHGATPRRVLSSWDGVILVVGLVLGAGIFRAPQLVAAGSSSNEMFLALWIGGGFV